ncbi:hypothetical protein BDK51DRAFT_46139 [Blyttiomyces helicus]|uniref:Uncharacterized protein n=1 Tax=Blyttiomyces helicus TaxID=388810 RepID=A0A4P9WJC7_9FUNG|nr:hypothetical protein BDK51DRAFT_46139 [Blyttiomyces helicus]|eukprot:RKO92934.1 hypothetical protein BDK51DRAFT_46139 [Blyttiomyces helicus]
MANDKMANQWQHYSAPGRHRKAHPGHSRTVVDKELAGTLDSQGPGMAEGVKLKTVCEVSKEAAEQPKALRGQQPMAHRIRMISITASSFVTLREEAVRGREADGVGRGQIVQVKKRTRTRCMKSDNLLGGLALLPIVQHHSVVRPRNGPMMQERQVNKGQEGGRASGEVGEEQAQSLETTTHRSPLPRLFFCVCSPPAAGPFPAVSSPAVSAALLRRFPVLFAGSAFLPPCFSFFPSLTSQSPWALNGAQPGAGNQVSSKGLWKGGKKSIAPTELAAGT